MAEEIIEKLDEIIDTIESIEIINLGEIIDTIDRIENDISNQDYEIDELNKKLLIIMNHFEI